MTKVLKDYERLTRAAAIVDVSHRTRMQIGGTDRQSFLHNLCTNDINRLTPGTGCEAFVTSVQGKCVGYISVFCHDDTLQIETVSGQAEFLLAHFDRYLISDDVQLYDRTTQTFALLIAGPEASKSLQSAFDRVAPDEPYQSASITYKGGSCWIAYVPWLEVPAWLMVGDVDNRALWNQALTDAGAAMVSDQALEIARIEAGFPWFGADVSDRNLPQEVARTEHAVSFTKGCYLGQETVARLDALGHVNRVLVQLRSPMPTAPESGSQVTVDGQAVGEITSSAVSPIDGSSVALAYVKCKYAESGTEVQLSNGAATVR